VVGERWRGNRGGRRGPLYPTRLGDEARIEDVVGGTGARGRGSAGRSWEELLNFAGKWRHGRRLQSGKARERGETASYPRIGFGR